MNKIQILVKNCLLVFVFVTIGFSLGKEMTIRNLPQNNLSSSEQKSDAVNATKNKIIVYYLHASFRCVTCNTIEKMTGELMNSYYKESLKNGSIEWKQADFQKNEELAKKYGVISSCVVVAQVRDGVETGYKRLDEVWTLMNDSDAFNQYIRDTITEFLNTQKPGGNS